MKRKRKTTALLLALGICCGVIPGCRADNRGSAPEFDFGLADNIADGAILHAWCWSFDTIKDSMADIAAAGYSAVQTSPANAVIEGGDGGMQLMGKGKWYYQYQPTDWTVGNYQLGTEDDLREMCEEADRYGIKVIVDVVPNHTAADRSAVSQSLIEAAGGADKLYHRNADKNISDYKSRTQCTLYSLTGLPDVNTENKGFQDYFIAYLNTLIADGADGFRYDTAKHIGLPDDPADDENAPNNFWERVTGEITDADRIFNYGEVLQGDNDRLADYIAAIGHTTASDYGKYIRMCASEGMLIADKLSDLQTGGSTDVVTWVESHDNYTDKTSVLLTDEQIVRGWSIIAASGLGTPLFFDRPLGSSYAEQFGKMNRIGAAGSPLYKDRTVAAVNRFRNAMTGTETLMSNPEGSAKVLLISRGSKGAVLVSGLKEDTEVSMPCYLPDGTYPDRSGNNPDLTVSGGVLSGTLRAGSTAVLYNEGYTEPVKMPEVSLETDEFAVYGDTAEVTLHVRGAGSGSFTVNGVTEPFTDGEKRTVTISGDECSVTLSAETGDGFASRMTYWFTKLRPAAAGDTISFVKPEDWSGDIYVYIYDETVHPMVKNAVWPGEAMIPVGDGSYTYTLPTDLGAALVIFSDSSGRQYPAAMEPGVDLEPGKEYTLP